MHFRNICKLLAAQPFRVTPPNMIKKTGVFSALEETIRFEVAHIADEIAAILFPPRPWYLFCAEERKICGPNGAKVRPKEFAIALATLLVMLDITRFQQESILPTNEIDFRSDQTLLTAELSKLLNLSPPETGTVLQHMLRDPNFTVLPDLGRLDQHQKNAMLQGVIGTIVQSNAVATTIEVCVRLGVLATESVGLGRVNSAVNNADPQGFHSETAQKIATFATELASKASITGLKFALSFSLGVVLCILAGSSVSLYRAFHESAEQTPDSSEDKNAITLTVGALSLLSLLFLPPLIKIRALKDAMTPKFLADMQGQIILAESMSEPSLISGTPQESRTLWSPLATLYYAGLRNYQRACNDVLNWLGRSGDEESRPLLAIPHSRPPGYGVASQIPLPAYSVGGAAINDPESPESATPVTSAAYQS